MRWLSFVVAMLIVILPLPPAVTWFWPNWVLVLLIYWNIFESDYLPLLVPFFLGIVMDLLTGTLLGAHALSFILVSFFARNHAQRFYHFPLFQQMGVVSLFSLINLLIYRYVGHLAGLPHFPWLYWMPVITNAIVWPLVVTIMRPKQEWAQY